MLHTTSKLATVFSTILQCNTQNKLNFSTEGLKFPPDLTYTSWKVLKVKKLSQEQFRVLHTISK